MIIAGIAVTLGGAWLIAGGATRGDGRTAGIGGLFFILGLTVTIAGASA